MNLSWEHVNRSLSHIIEYNFRYEDLFKRETEQLEKDYSNYCFACKELGVQPKPKPPIPSWRDPAYVDVYTLRIRDFFVKRLVHLPHEKWVVKSQRGFPISEVTSTLKEDLKFLKARKRSAQEKVER